LNDKKEDFDYRIFEANMKKKLQIPKDGCSIVDVDLMSGDEFENFVAKIFSKLGYLTKVTQHSRDFGVDVISEKDGIKIAIQAKCYTNPVSISAIQEVTAGMTHYNCQRGVIVTNRTFTKAAIELASSNSIQLWDRKKLEEKISEVL
jgi:HJR/Mrr/RecB family endonuclease